jgi:hypothetical protein
VLRVPYPAEYRFPYPQAPPEIHTYTHANIYNYIYTEMSVSILPLWHVHAVALWIK